MSKVIKKKIKIPLGMKDQNIAEMFNQMLGADSVNMSIAYPRYLRIKDILTQLLRIFEMLNNSPFMSKVAEFAPQRAEITDFIQLSREYLAGVFTVDLSEYEWDLHQVDEEQRKIFAEVYENIRKSNIVNTFIIMCDRLVTYKKYISDVNKLNPVFITAMPGVEFCPFPFTKLNLKYIFSLHDVGEHTRRFFMVVLNKAYELSHKLWGEITSPDINVDDFVDVIMANIKEIQRQPELNRCGKAFKKIEESVNLLKNRFGNYYRDFIQTKTPTIMMEHFILDVSGNTKADPETTRQFRQIIAFYRKNAQSKISDPKIKMLFDRVNESFKNLERNTDNLAREGNDSDADDELNDDDDLSSDETNENGVTDQAADNLRRAQELSQTKSIDELVDFIEGKK